MIKLKEPEIKKVLASRIINKIHVGGEDKTLCGRYGSVALTDNIQIVTCKTCYASLRKDVDRFIFPRRLKFLLEENYVYIVYLPKPQPYYTLDERHASMTIEEYFEATATEEVETLLKHLSPEDAQEVETK